MTWHANTATAGDLRATRRPCAGRWLWHLRVRSETTRNGWILACCGWADDAAGCAAAVEAEANERRAQFAA